MADESDDPSPWRELLERVRAIGLLVAGKGDDLPPWKRFNASSFLLGLVALTCVGIEEGASWGIVAKTAQTDKVEWDGLVVLWHVIIATLPLTIWMFLWVRSCLRLGEFPFLSILFLGAPTLWLVAVLSSWLGFPHSRFGQPSLWLAFREGPNYVIAYAHIYGGALFFMSALCGAVLGVIAWAWRVWLSKHSVIICVKAGAQRLHTDL